MNYYEPKHLRGVLSKVEPPHLFFRTQHFTEQVSFPTETVSFEFSRTTKRLLPYASPSTGSVPIDRSGYQLRTYRAPLIAGSRTITPDTISQKLLGEAEWNSGISPDDRARELAANDLLELQDALYRKQEYMCARVKQDGKLLITGDGVSAEVDYGFTNIETAKANEKWTATYDIIGKLTKTARLLRKHGTNPDTLIVGSDVAEAMSLNEGVLKLRHDEYLSIPEPDSLADGITYLFNLRAPGLNLNVLEYDEYYADENGSLQPLIDPGTVIMQSSRERDFMLFGAVTYIDSRTRDYAASIGEYAVYNVIEEDPPVRKLVLASRCLPMPRDNDSWYVLKSVV